jgi:hypothetical protein
LNIEYNLCHDFPTNVLPPLDCDTGLWMTS